MKKLISLFSVFLVLFSFLSILNVNADTVDTVVFNSTDLSSFGSYLTFASQDGTINTLYPSLSTAGSVYDGLLLQDKYYSFAPAQNQAYPVMTFLNLSLPDTFSGFLSTNYYHVHFELSFIDKWHNSSLTSMSYQYLTDSLIFGYAVSPVSSRTVSLSSGTRQVTIVTYDFTVKGSSLTSDFCRFTFNSGSDQPELSGAFGLYSAFNIYIPSNNSALQDGQANADAIAGIGSDVPQPDFSSQNEDLNNAASAMDNMDALGEIDNDAVNSLGEDVKGIYASDTARGIHWVSLQIENFLSHVTPFRAFIITSLTLGIAFYALGRGSKGGSDAS